MKNKPHDLVNHLFAQVERLGDEQLSNEQIETEAKRATAMVEAADQISDIWKLQLNAAKLVAMEGERVIPMLPDMRRKEENE